MTYFGVFFAGLLSFLSPCILPIVPFYLSYLAGVSMNQISADAEITSSVRRRAVIAAFCFSLGVITVFVGMGATATMFGQMVRAYFDILRWVAAAIIIAMGLHFSWRCTHQFSLSPAAGKYWKRIKCWVFWCLCHWFGICLRLDTMRWTGSGGNTIYGGWTGNLDAGCNAIIHLRIGDDTTIYRRSIVYRSVYVLDGAFPFQIRHH